jgi:hypothetical protein
MHTLLLFSAFAAPRQFHTEQEPTHVSPDGRLARVVLHEAHGEACVIEHRLIETDELVAPARVIPICEPGRFGLPDLLKDEQNLSWIALDEADLDSLQLRLVWFTEDLSLGHSQGGSLLVSASEGAVPGG